MRLEIGQKSLSDCLCRQGFVQSVEIEFLARFVFKVNIRAHSGKTVDASQKTSTLQHATTMYTEDTNASACKRADGT